VARWLIVAASLLVARPQALVPEGAAFGRGKHPQQCIEESLRRARADNRAAAFAASCLHAAGRSPAYCAEVPWQIIDEAEWAADECARRGMRTPPCTEVYIAVSDYCHPWR
jgi:hypothetical protein